MRLIAFALLVILAKSAFAQTVSISVDLKGSSIDDVDLIDSGGTLMPGSGSNKIQFSLPLRRLKGASISAFRNGQYVGAVGQIKGRTLQFRFAAKPKDKRNKDLRKIALRLNPVAAGAAYVSARANGVVFSGGVATSKITNLGLNPASAQSASGVRIRSAQDSDGDSVPDIYDVDADGDSIIDIADSNVEAQRDSVTALPFTTLFLPLQSTVNWHINNSLNQSAIDAIIGGENLFSIAYFFNFPSDGPTASLASNIAGARVVCSDDLTYCSPSSPGTAIYSGFSESNNSIRGALWSTLNASGAPYSLERLNISGGGAVWAAGVQPRVGTTQFRPGDSYRVDFVNNSGSIIARRALTLPPYFVTAPALRAFNGTDNDAGNDTLINYSNSSGPGMTQGSAIAIANSGSFSGKLRMNIWRLQRLAVEPLESGQYRDFGHLNYGVMINNNSGEFTCGGLYEGLSSTLTERSSQGNGGSYQSNQGALLWPLVDSSDDYLPSSASDSTTIGNNTISLTVNLTECRIRNGLAPGAHQITITAAGADTGNGANRAAQMLWVNIP
jgi:hypothetical protein